MGVPNKSKLERNIEDMLEYLMNGMSEAIVKQQMKKINVNELRSKEDAIKLINELYNAILHIAGKEHADRIRERLIKEVEDFD